MKGYKVFNKDWTCRGKQYTCPGYFEENVTPKICKVGMHFCERAIDCFHYYGFDPDNHVAEVEAVGKIERSYGKLCTNKLKIIREIPWNEVLSLVNIGENCTGKANTGNDNSGDHNSGDCNSGFSNSGNCNSGLYNSGCSNSGYCNSGDWNAGNCNSGWYNSGNHNSGDHNSGSWNTGNRNIGNYNTGAWNFTSRSAGCFCTEKQKIKMFDKETNWTFSDWYRSNGRKVMLDCPKDTRTIEWTVTESGYPKVNVNGTCEERQEWWDNLEQSAKQAVYELPNFDANKFYKCTGIKVDLDGYDYCNECRGCGDDYSFDDDRELVDNCTDCTFNPNRKRERG